MAYRVTMPQMGYDMTEGSINRWLVEEGAAVARGDLIASIATDKADIDIEAYASGVLRQILVQPGSRVPVGQAIAIIADVAEELVDSPEPVSAPSRDREAGPADGGESSRGQAASARRPPPAPPRPERPPAGAPGPGAPAALSPDSSGPRAEPAPAPEWAQAPTDTEPEPSLPRDTPAGSRIKASPLARRRARELGISLQGIVATGPGGRIKAEDVETASAGGVGVALAALSGEFGGTIDPGDPSELVTLSRMRETIGRRMVEAKTSIPHFYLTTEAAMGSLLELRAELNQLGDAALPRFSVTDFIIRALALTLQRHPNLNAAWAGDGLRRYSQSNIALAVALPDGLLAPVLRRCEVLPLAELARRAHDLVARARSSRLRPEELSGGHALITNLGMFGVSQFAAIIPPGQGSALAVGEVREVPVLSNGQLVPGHQLALTLSIDHRVIDGAAAAEALAYLRWCLEHPAACLI
jgi:pyruvate dehydrogenase E2 component (dihydrolipoamide acetyltransferase)